MSRVIKFRAWDGEQMHKESFCEYLSGYGCMFHQFLKPVAVMQFTGLFDKNGKEIYEGDILFWDGSCIGAVSFEHCEFIVGSGKSARAMCAIKDASELEIIGDVYSTPELLK